jgi:hypothetical protein
MRWQAQQGFQPPPEYKPPAPWQQPNILIQVSFYIVRYHFIL